MRFIPEELGNKYLIGVASVSFFLTERMWVLLNYVQMLLDSELGGRRGKYRHPFDRLDCMKTLLYSLRHLC